MYASCSQPLNESFDNLQEEEDKAAADEKTLVSSHVVGYLRERVGLLPLRKVAESLRLAEMLAQTTLQQAELKVKKDLADIQRYLQEKQAHANRQARAAVQALRLQETAVMLRPNSDMCRARWTCDFWQPGSRKGRRPFRK